MPRTRALSNHARAVLAALLDAGAGWSHGYELCRTADVKSGTLYPLLIRLEAQGYLEAEWQQPTEGGRPPRHAYRLTQTGVQLARDNPPDRKVAARSGLREVPT
ncbi:MULTISPECIES: PadR family transcriptional regulator [unclassified Corallococcus]|uniref:PadR family transcriptional regulator n=1 Tax=unclassified Corallococcus TaxID=2685029 RepID=UPI001A8F5FA0|nr:MULTISPECIES: PadR family transcriptional regulator [unclassified Corallococcus]MBN9681235.1 PadR family transcriptional regulator [Corallococcus sp. NCSPR001]WAS87184.1 PadR family transcriptional regulator [Corallococcus sp. NCRR]